MVCTHVSIGTQIEDLLRRFQLLRGILLTMEAESNTYRIHLDLDSKEIATTLVQGNSKWAATLNGSSLTHIVPVKTVKVGELFSMAIFVRERK
jgi:hypothetical protein